MQSSKVSLQSTLRLLGAVFISATLVGCASSPAPVTPPAVYPSISGNWQFEIQGAGSFPPPNIPVIELFGTLVSSGSQITGTLNAHSGTTPGCIKNNADLVITGSIDTAGNMTLNTPLAGGTATFTTTNHLGASTTPNGAYQVVGGTCAQASTTLAGYQVASVTGTYSGTLPRHYPTGLGSLTIVASFVQSSTATADGLYPLTGTVTYSGDCSGTLTFNNGIVYGAVAQSAPFSADFSTSTQLFSIAVPSATTQPVYSMFYLPDRCGDSAYQGNLTRQ